MGASKISREFVAAVWRMARGRLSASVGSESAEVSADVTKKSGSNFYFAFLFLPRERRRAIYSVYAYCRLIDDIVDGPEPTEAKEAELARWHGELERAFAPVGSPPPEHPIAQGLRDASLRFGLRHEDALAVLRGCEMDLHKTRYETWDELRSYCYHVASAVGLLCIGLFGCSDPRSRDYAIHLGQALQLTNILRDIAEDAQKGRIYVPREALSAHGVSEADVLDGRPGRGAASLVADLSRRARAEYAAAAAARTRTDHRALLPAEIMGRIYFALLQEVERRGTAVLVPGPRPKLTGEQKLSLALSALAEAALPFGLAQRLRSA
ncbi:MAG: presqualene diphosphate synthase HpnD [Polyangia bacterium]